MQSVAMLMFFYLIALSAVQALALRHSVRAAWRWIAAHAAAVVIFVVAYQVVLELTRTEIYAVGVLLLGMFPVTAAVTGVAMYRILLPSLSSDKSKREGGEDFIPAAANAAIAKPSVWDEAN